MHTKTFANALRLPALDRALLAQGSVLILLFAFCYHKVFTVLLHAWWHNSVYSHGFLIPFVSMYLVWARRDRLAALAPRPEYFLGLTVLVSGALALVAGQAAGVIMVQEISIIITLLGAVLLILGKRFFYALLFPVLYLGFMIRFWDSLTAPLHLPMQNMSAYLASKLIQAAGITAVRHSIYIDLPDMTLEVADVCSGINYLIAVVATGIPLAYLALEGWKKRVLLVASAVAIAALGNSVRIGLIGILGHYGFTQTLHGPMHVLQAMFVSVIGFAALFLGAFVLSKGGTGRDKKAPDISRPERVRQKKMPVVLASSILLIAGFYINFHKTYPVKFEKAPEKLSAEINGWKAVQAHTSDLPGIHGAELVFARPYRASSGSEAEVLIGYYDYQTQDREMVGSETAHLHARAVKRQIVLDNGSSVEVNLVKNTRDGKNMLTVFWYDLNGRIASDRKIVKAYTAWDALVRSRTNGAIVVLSIYPNGESESYGEIEEFIKGFIPASKEFLWS